MGAPDQAGEESGAEAVASDAPEPIDVTTTGRAVGVGNLTPSLSAAGSDRVDAFVLLD